jgi:class 3 adenylate cyclase
MTLALPRLRRPATPTRPGPPLVLRLYLAGGLVAICGFHFLPADSLFQDTIYYPLIGFSCVVAILAGILLYRPARPEPWLLLAAGQLLFVIGDVLFGIDQHILEQVPFPSPADGFYLAGYPVLAAGLWLLVRQRSNGRDWAAPIDAAIVTVALGVVAWELLIIPYTADDTLSTVQKAVSIGYPLGDVLLLAMAARLMFDHGERTLSSTLIVASLVCLLIADPLYALLTIRDNYGSGSPLDAGWMLAYVFAGAAALDPSMRVVNEPPLESTPKLTLGRLALLAAAALTAPIVLAFHPERIGVACSAALFLLVGARLAGIVRRHQRALARESRLRAAAARLVSATSDGEVHRAAVETAVAFAGGAGARATLRLEGDPEPVARATDGVTATATISESYPLRVRGEARGALEVETSADLAREDRAALATLADQVSLALETIARAREQAEAESARVRDYFSRFVPEAVVDQLLAQTGGTLHLGGETLDGTIMFTDLRGFTSFSESRPAEEVITVINRFLSEQTDTIMAHGGTIIAYLGDGIMAAWGAPLAQPDHAERALGAARELLATKLPELNGWMREHGYGDGFRMGIGVNSGAFISGNVGHERRLEYTAIGDVCNTASRIQELTKGTRHMLLFSEETLARLGAAPADVVDVGASPIRGRNALARLWSLEEVSDQPGAERSRAALGKTA